MALYSRLLAHQARATDEIHNMLQAYPDGVTVGQLMRDNHERLKDPNSVLAAIDLLVEESKAKREQLGWHENHLDSVKIYLLDQKRARKTNCR
jgi:galactokinase